MALRSPGVLLGVFALARHLYASGSYGIFRDDDERWWWATGVVAGAALLTKYMLAFWLIVLAVGLAGRLVASCGASGPGSRDRLRHRPAQRAWQEIHDWPFLVICRVAAENKNLSGHNNYGLWGPHGYDGSVVIRFGEDRAALLHAYASVEPASVFDNPWAMPYERRQTLWLCRGRRMPFDHAWASFGNYR